MLHTIQGLALATWGLFREMAPYLLFGFGIAGVLYILIPRERIVRHFSRNNLASVFKAALLGVPLPLCSCGVIPVAAHLRKEGASKSATMAFLLSTPSTGVDSIFATYSLLGIAFAVVRPVAALFAGFLAGLLTIFSDRTGTNQASWSGFSCSVCSDTKPHAHGLWATVKAMLKYAFFDLIGDTGKWILAGVLIGGLISYFIPAIFIQQYLSRPGLAYPLMILIGIPMYVCATGSIPIAASLILKGMTPGAGLVFLITGPATNTATISFVLGKLGKKSLAVYLAAIIITALVFGFFIDRIWLTWGKDVKLFMPGMVMLPGWVTAGSGILLAFFIVNALVRRRNKEITDRGMIFKVPDMECRHCVQTIIEKLKTLPGVQAVNINLKRKEVEVTGDADEKMIREAVQQAGYTAASRIR